MKIYDIISEGGIPGLGALYGSIARLSTKAATRARAVEKLTQQWVSDAAAAGPGNAIRAITAGEKQAKASGIADDVILDAKLAANKIIRDSEVAVAKAAAGRVIGSSWEAVNKWTSMLGVGVPVAKCAWEINNAYTKAAAGDPNFQGEKLDYAIQAALDKCVEQLLALGIGRGIIKVGAAIPKGFFGTFVNSPAIDKAFNGLARAGQTAFTAWLLSPPGQEALAKYVVGNSFGASQFRWLRDEVGAWAMDGYDAIMNAIGKPLPGYGAAQQQAQAAKPGVDATSSAAPGVAPVPKSMFDPRTGALLK
jgi:hypothetical protein